MAKQPLLRPEEVASVLSSPSDTPEERPAAAAVAKPGEPSPYSLRRPVVIAPEGEPAARKRIEELLAALGRMLRRELEAELEIEVQGFQQEQAGSAVQTLPQPAWILSFLEPEGGGLALALDPTCALSLVELALGGAGNTSGSAREPTPLESRVLSKLCNALVGPFAAATGTSFTQGTFSKGEPPRELAAPGQTVGVGLLRIRIAATDRTGLLLASPRTVQPVERRSAGGPPRVGPLAPLLGRVRVGVRAVLEAGLVPLSDLAALRPGTLLRLDAAEDRPLVLRVNDRDVFKGHVSREKDELLFHVHWRRGRRRTVRAKEKP